MRCQLRKFRARMKENWQNNPFFDCSRSNQMRLTDQITDNVQHVRPHFSCTIINKYTYIYTVANQFGPVYISIISTMRYEWFNFRDGVPLILPYRIMFNPNSIGVKYSLIVLGGGGFTPRFFLPN